MCGKILSISVVSRPSGDPYLTISQTSTIFSKLGSQSHPIPIPFQSNVLSSVRDFGYDYDYGYGYVKSVDSMDNVNSVRSADNVNSMDNINSANSGVIRRRGGARGMKGALLALSTSSMLLTLSALRTLLTLSVLSTLLT